MSELLPRMKYRNRGNCCEAHVWFQCYEKGYFGKNYTYSNPKPDPTHISTLSRKSQAFFFLMVDHTKSHTIKYFPIYVIYTRE